MVLLCIVDLRFEKGDLRCDRFSLSDFSLFLLLEKSFTPLRWPCFTPFSHHFLKVLLDRDEHESLVTFDGGQEAFFVRDDHLARLTLLRIEEDSFDDIQLAAMKLLVRWAKQLHQRLKGDCLLLGIENLLSAHVVEYFETVRIQLVIHRHDLFELRFATGVRRGSLCV